VSHFEILHHKMRSHPKTILQSAFKNNIPQMHFKRITLI
jgi:ribosomal protein S7